MTRDILKIINLVSSICMCLYSPGRGIQGCFTGKESHSKKAISNSILLPSKENLQSEELS